MCVSYRCLIYIEVFVAVAVLVVVVGTFGTLVHAHTHTQQMEKTLHLWDTFTKWTQLGDSRLISWYSSIISGIYLYCFGLVYAVCVCLAICGLKTCDSKRSRKRERETHQVKWSLQQQLRHLRTLFRMRVCVCAMRACVCVCMQLDGRSYTCPTLRGALLETLRDTHLEWFGTLKRSYLMD